MRPRPGLPVLLISLVMAESSGPPDSDSKELLRPFCLFLGGLVTSKRCGKGFITHRVLAQLRGVA